MDANQKPQMTRKMMERLYGNMNTQGGNRGPYGVTEGLSAVPNRSSNLDRRYIKSYRSSMVANNSDNRRYTPSSGVSGSVQSDNSSSVADAGLSGGNRQVNGVQSGGNQTLSSNNSRQSFNANRTTFREPPSRGYNPFG